MKLLGVILVCILFVGTELTAQVISLRGVIIDNQNCGVEKIKICSTYKEIKVVKSNRKGIFKLNISATDSLIFLTPDNDVYSIPVVGEKRDTFMYLSDKKQILYNNMLIVPLLGAERESVLSYFAGPYAKFPNAFAVVRHECPSIVIDYDQQKLFVTRVSGADPGVLILLNNTPIPFHNLENLSTEQIKSVQLLKREEELHIYKTSFSEPFSAILKIQSISF